VRGRLCLGWCSEIRLEEEKMRMACLENGGTASVAGKERGMVASEGSGRLVCVLFFSPVGRATGLLKKRWV